MAGKAVSFVNVRFGAESKLLRSELARLSGSLARFQKQVGGLARTFGVAFGGAMVVRGLRSGINKIAELEAEMSKVRAITGATAKEFDALKNNALEMGRSTKFTAQQVAQLQVEFGKLGFSSREIVNSTEATLDLATATGEDLATAATVAGSTLRALQLDSSEMSRVTDVMAKSFTSSALDLSKFTDSMKFAAPVAKAAGVEIEFVTAMLSTLADAGVNGSIAGTSMRRILNSMAATGKPAAEAFAEVASKGITLASAMDEVGRFAQTSLTILGANTSKVYELADAYDHAGGSAAEMASVVEDNLLGDLTKLSSAWDGQIQKGGVFAGVLRDIVQTATLFLGGGESFVSEMTKQIGDEVNIRNLKYIRDGLVQLRDAAEKAFNAEKVEEYNGAIKALDERVGRLNESFTGPTIEPPDINPLLKAQEEIRKAQEDARAIEEQERKTALEAFKKDQAKRSQIIEEYYTNLQDHQQTAIDTWKDETETLNALTDEWVQGADDVKTGLEGLQETLSNLEIETPETEETTDDDWIKDKEEREQAEADINRRRVDMAVRAGQEIGAALQMEGEDRRRAIQDMIKANASMIISDLIRSAVASLPPPFNIAAGFAAATIGGILVNKIPALAEGAIVTGPTLAMIGEGKHPEAVIPLPNGMQSMGATNVNVTVEGVARGEEIYYLIKKVEKRLNNSR